MDAAQKPSDEQYRVQEIKKFSTAIIIAAIFLSFAPAIYAMFVRSGDSAYLGHQTSLDDHMHYASWMRQAADGQILFDNRFTTEEQPRLTFHAYFLILGWIASITSILFADLLARLVFGFLFLWLLTKLLIKHRVSIYISKFALALAVFGSGVGALVWENFGREAATAPEWVKAILGPWLPIDVWQPEAFIFPSLMTNGLFMASGCLILLIVDAIISCREDAKSVWVGGLAMLLLMNIHSYDVLLLALVAVGFLAIQFGGKDLDLKWALKGVGIFLFALPAALWFLYVLSRDPVFQARAATETYSGTFRQTLLGILPAFLLASVNPLLSESVKRRIGMGIILAICILLYVLAGNADPSAYFMGVVPWIGLFLTVCFALSRMDTGDRFKNFLWAWATVGLIAPYFPALFQRKLGMLLILPWAILAAYGLANILMRLERSPRNLVSALALVLACIGSLLWLQREFGYIRHNVASTTTHPVFVSAEVSTIMETLDEIEGRRVVISMPGVPSMQDGPFPFATPYIPDLAPILSGHTGAYSYAGHWSETPDYNQKRSEVAALFLAQTPDMAVSEFLSEHGVTHIVAPVPQTFSEVPLRSMEQLGHVIAGGRQFQLIEVSR